MNLILVSVFLLGFGCCYLIVWAKNKRKSDEIAQEYLREFNENFDFISPETAKKWAQKPTTRRVYIPSKDESRVLMGSDESYFIKPDRQDV